MSNKQSTGKKGSGRSANTGKKKAAVKSNKPANTPDQQTKAVPMHVVLRVPLISANQVYFLPDAAEFVAVTMRTSYQQVANRKRPVPLLTPIAVFDVPTKDYLAWDKAVAEQLPYQGDQKVLFLTRTDPFKGQDGNYEIDQVPETATRLGAYYIPKGMPGSSSDSVLRGIITNEPPEVEGYVLNTLPKSGYENWLDIAPAEEPAKSPEMKVIE